MPGTHFTVLILDDAHHDVRRIMIRRDRVVFLATLFVVVVVAACALTIHYATLAPHVLDARELRTANDALKRRLATLTAHTGDADADLAVLDNMESRLRALSGVSPSQSSLMKRPEPARGGAQTFERDEAFAVPLEGDDAFSVDARLDVLDGRISLMAAEARGERRSLAELFGYFDGREAILRSTPSIAPTRGFLTSGFGTRSDPFTNEDSGHSGDDIAAPLGSDVVAPADGLVVLAGEHGGYGNCVILEHRTGLTTVYGHLSKILVRAGDRVVRGERIGQVGSTGRSTGPHLHYEVRTNGVPVNPRRFIIQ